MPKEFEYFWHDHFVSYKLNQVGGQGACETI